MEASFFTRYPKARDFLSFIGFVVFVVIGTLLINTFVFRSFQVSGHSMDHTLADGQRLIVSRLPATKAQLSNQEYLPKRGQIIVFKNPLYVSGGADEYIVKRVIALPGERVTVSDGILTVYNTEYPNGHVYDTAYRKDGVGPQSPTSGDDIDVTVPDSSIFVSGDNRIGNNSYDSRSGLGFIPSFDIVGPVTFRIFPFTTLHHF